MRFVKRYVAVPWGDVKPSDLEPQGEAETTIDYRHETHLGLYVKGEHIAYLGMLAVRCESRGMSLVPIGLAIADTPALEQVPVQSNPRRVRVDVDLWREEGA